jgi:hypothetical protein
MTTHVDDLHKRTIIAAGALAEHATGDLLRISGLTDEEILALDLADFDLPWVTARESIHPEYSRDEARLAALRSLIVRGGVTTERIMAAAEGRGTGPDPHTFTPSALLSGILARRALAPTAVRVAGPAEEPSPTMRSFVDADGSVLHEVTSPDGLHHFLMSDLEHAVEALLARVDPEGATPERAALEGVHSGSWEELERDDVLGPVLASASRRTRLRIDDRRAGSRSELSIAAGPDGSVILRAAADGSALEAVAVSAEELRELLASLLELTPARE